LLRRARRAREVVVARPMPPQAPPAEGGVHPCPAAPPAARRVSVPRSHRAGGAPVIREPPGSVAPPLCWRRHGSSSPIAAHF
jgi:hypothetical protein